MVGAKILIVEPRMLEKTSAAAKECGIPKNRMFAFDLVEPSKDAEVKSWSTLLQHGESNFVSVPNPDTTVAAYQTSSGTSGLPKAALIPHSYLRSQALSRFTDPSIPYKVQVRTPVCDKRSQH
jgi:4-coumarate--CoA ligase